MVRKSRSFERNSAFVNRMVDLYEQYTVGTGIRYHAASSNPEWNKWAQDEIDTWAEMPDVSSRHSFYQLQGIRSRSRFVDGEIFVNLTTGGTDFPRIQLIECQSVDSPSDRVSDENMCEGVELDPRGRPIAYHVRQSDNPSDPKFRRIPAEFIVHDIEPSRVGQYRGIPLVHPVINDIQDLDELQLLEMQAAKENAAVTRVIKRKGGEAPPDGDLIRGTVTDSAGKSWVNYYRQLFNGGANILNEGDDYSQEGGERPSAATSGYWDYLVGKICLGVGFPKALVDPSSMQGTSMRAVLDGAAAWFRIRSAAMSECDLRIIRYVLQERIKKNPRLQRGLPEDWNRLTYLPPRSINVDIGDRSKAQLEQFKAGMLTLQDIYAERGEDWEMKLRQKAVEMKRAHDLATEFEIDVAELITIDPNQLASANANSNPQTA